MTQSELYKQDYVDAALTRYKYNTVEDMYAAVGFGAISPVKIIARMLEEYRKEHKEEDIEEKIQELSQARKTHTKPSKAGIIVKGIDNCLVKLSKCCNPVPGDDIIGYITKGRGVSVHRKDCINLTDLLEQEDRMIDVEWYNEANASYTVDVEVYSGDRNGLLADILEVSQKNKTKIISVTSRVTKEKTVITDITLQVENREELHNALKAIRKVNSVYEVKRKK